MAAGSWRTTPTSDPSAAAVFCDAVEAERSTPWVQSSASWTSGMVLGRRPPKMRAETGTPPGFAAAGSRTGQLAMGAVNLALGWAAGVPASGSNTLPRQSIVPSGGVCGPASPLIPSHHTSPSGVSATLVKMQFLVSERTALGLESIEVPGATPKNPASGLMA